jgi:hypothetical protein
MVDPRQRCARTRGTLVNPNPDCDPTSESLLVSETPLGHHSISDGQRHIRDESSGLARVFLMHKRRVNRCG